MNLLDRMEAHERLGNEFLTWLYATVCLTDTGMATIPLEPRWAPRGCSTVSVAFERTMQLANDKTRVTLAGGDPSHSDEARLCIYNGMLVTQLRVCLAWTPDKDQPLRQIEATIKGKTLGLSACSLAVSALEREEVIEDMRFVDLADRMAELDALVLALYKRFLERREDDDWEDEERAIRQWAKGGAADDDA